MKQMKNAATDESQPRVVRRRRTAKSKTLDSTLPLNREGEWMGSDELRTYLLALPLAPGKNVLDMAGLTHVDAACFQVLVSALQSGLFADGNVQLVNASDHVRNCFHYAGAEKLLVGADEAR